MFLSVIQKWSITMYEVNDNDRSSYLSYYFYCRFWQKVLLYDAERDLLAIAKCLVSTTYKCILQCKGRGQP